MKIHLGCGKNKKKGYVNCDISKEVNPDKIVNIEKRMPFKSSSVEEVIAEHVIEHSKEPIKVMKEIYRICKDGAIIKIKVPYFSHESAFSQIDHYSFFSLTTFDCLDKDHFGSWQGVGDFKTIKKKLKWRKGLGIFTKFFNLNYGIMRLYQEVLCWIIPAKELEVWLKIRK